MSEQRLIRMHLRELRTSADEDAAGTPILVLETDDDRVELHPGAEGATVHTAFAAEVLAAHAREYAVAQHFLALRTDRMDR
jgi:hypothetical protein